MSLVTIELPDSTEFHNLYTLTGFPSGSSLIVNNNTNSPLFLVQSPTQPLSSAAAYPIPTGDTALVHHDDDPVWLMGPSDSPIIVQTLTNTITPFTSIELPHGLYTSEREDYRRIRVDVAQTGFFEGREFRTFKELSIPIEGVYVVKAVVPIDIILFALELDVDAGGVRMTTKLGGTEGGDFSETLPIIAKNRMSTVPQPPYTAQTVLTAGGTHSGGTAIDIVRVLSANQQNSRTTVGSRVSDERGVAAGTYYFVLENLSNTAVSGTFKAWFEERP